MSTTQELERRLARVEEEVRRLRMQADREQGTVSGRTAPDFLARFSGIFADDPTFAEAVRLGREWRDADRPQEDEPPGITEPAP